MILFLRQVFEIANSILGSSDERFSLIRTYKVVPISSRLGVIEFLPNTTTYKSLACKGRVKEPPVVVGCVADFKV